MITDQWPHPHKSVFKPTVAVFADSTSAPAIEHIQRALSAINNIEPIDTIFSCGGGTGIRTIDNFRADHFGKMNWAITFTTAEQYVTAMSLPLELIFIVGSKPEPTYEYRTTIQKFISTVSKRSVVIHVLTFGDCPDEFAFSLSRSGSTPGVFVRTVPLPTDQSTNFINTIEAPIFDKAVKLITENMGIPSPRVSIISADKIYPAVTISTKESTRYYLFGELSDPMVNINTGMGSITIPHNRIIPISEQTPQDRYRYALAILASGDIHGFIDYKATLEPLITYRTPGWEHYRKFLNSVVDSTGEKPVRNLQQLSLALRSQPNPIPGIVATSQPPVEYETVAGESYQEILLRGDFIVHGGTTFDRQASSGEVPSVFPMPLYINEEHAAMIVRRINEYTPNILKQQTLNILAAEYEKQTPDNHIIKSAQWVYSQIVHSIPSNPFAILSTDRISSDPYMTLIEQIAANVVPQQYALNSAMEEEARRQLADYKNKTTAELETTIWKLLANNISSEFRWDQSVYPWDSATTTVSPTQLFKQAITQDPEAVLAHLETPNELFIFPQLSKLSHLYQHITGAPPLPEPHVHIAMCLQNLLQSNNHKRLTAIKAVPTNVPIGGTQPYMLKYVELSQYNDFISPGNDIRAYQWLQTLYIHLSENASQNHCQGDLELFASTLSMETAAKTLFKHPYTPDIVDIFLEPMALAKEKFHLIHTNTFRGHPLMLQHPGKLEINPKKLKKIMKQINKQ